MGYRHTKQDILAGAVASAVDGGLSRLSFGRVAHRLGINDRTVVYYFPRKDDLVAEVLLTVGAQLLERLAPACSAPVRDHIELARAAWPVVAHADADPVLALFFEANGLAVSGREPYRTVVPQLVEAWIAWAETVMGGDQEQRRIEAETAIALIDGVLLLRHLAGPAAAERAAHRLGIC